MKSEFLIVSGNEGRCGREKRVLKALTNHKDNYELRHISSAFSSLQLGRGGLDMNSVGQQGREAIQNQQILENSGRRQALKVYLLTECMWHTEP